MKKTQVNVTLSDAERAQLGQPRGKSKYKVVKDWPAVRQHLLSRSLKSNPALKSELTAYTPGETLKLLDHPEIKSWHKAVSKHSIPAHDENKNPYTHVIFVPCAKTKPWAGGDCKINKSIYGSYHKLRQDMLKRTGKLPNAYFVTISEPLGIVPQDRWHDFPQYDNPGLFRNDAQRGMFSKEWKNLPKEKGGTGETQYVPFDDESYHKSIDRLSQVIADFVQHNRNKNKDLKFVSFVDDTDYRPWANKSKPPKTISTHSDMLSRANHKLNFMRDELRFKKRGKARQKPYDYMSQVLGNLPDA
jgi:hypothetical protein